MEEWLSQVITEGRVFTVSTVFVLLGVSASLLRRLFLGERDKLQREADMNTSATEQLVRRVESLEVINVTNMQRISLLTERDEARAAEYISLKARIDTLDNRLEALSRDLHTGISEIKTLIIHQRHL